MSSWIMVATVTLSRDWTAIPLTESKILRVRRFNPPNPPVKKWSRGYVARVLVVDGIPSYWGYRKIWDYSDPLILDFRNQPFPIEGAVLAVRHAQSPQFPWQLLIEAPDGGYDDPELPLVQCIESIQPSFEGGYQ
jgi:hypothetical protein